MYSMIQEKARKLVCRWSAALLLVCCFCFAVISPALAVSPRVHAFYYPWYHSLATDGNWDHWEDSTHWVPENLSAEFYPMLGPYSANSNAVVPVAFTRSPSIRGRMGSFTKSWVTSGFFCGTMSR